MKASEWSFTPFQGLGEALRKHNCTLNQKPIPVKKPAEKRTDEEIFREAMADVREIREFRAMPPKKPPAYTPSPRKDDTLDILRQIVDREKKIKISDTGEYMEWTNPKIRKDISEKLHQGCFSVQDYIDLHGMTLTEAEEAFSSFIRHAVKHHLFCIKVIHGRGLRSPRGPVLKTALERWLQGTFRKWVLAYTTAKDCDGGLGATYVILKTK